MGKWKGITADELIALRQIERINFQLRSIAKEFGTESRLYKHYENFLTSTRKNTLAEAGLLRETSGGVLQLRADKRAVKEYQYSAYQKALNRVGRFQTVGQRKQQMLRAYQKRTGTDLSDATRREIRAAYTEEKDYEKTVYETVNDTLYKYYELEKKVGNGKELVSHDDLRRLSKGSHTDPKDLEEMLRIANEELQKVEHIVKEEYDDYLAGL